MISVTDANGAAITDSTHIANVNPLRYRGYYYDSETGLYYLQSRYYDPAVKRFINADDSNILLDDQGNILQYNLFAYCFDNPVNMYDEDGHYAASLTKRALSLGVTMSTLLLALKLLGLSNAWNVAGWVILGAVAAITVGVVGYKIYKSSKSKKTKKTAKKVEKKRRMMLRTGQKDRGMILISRQTEMLGMCLIRNMRKGTIRLDQTQNIAKLKSGYSATKAISDGVI